MLSIIKAKKQEDHLGLSAFSFISSLVNKNTCTYMFVCSIIKFNIGFYLYGVDIFVNNTFSVSFNADGCTQRSCGVPGYEHQF